MSGRTETSLRKNWIDNIRGEFLRPFSRMRSSARESSIIYNAFIIIRVRTLSVQPGRKGRRPIFIKYILPHRNERTRTARVPSPDSPGASPNLFRLGNRVAGPDGVRIGLVRVLPRTEGDRRIAGARAGVRRAIPPAKSPSYPAAPSRSARPGRISLIASRKGGILSGVSPPSRRFETRL